MDGGGRGEVEDKEKKRKKDKILGYCFRYLFWWDGKISYHKLFPVKAETEVIGDLLEMLLERHKT